jgi:TonB-dependent starch-binding outer membrane protein SusC
MNLPATIRNSGLEISLASTNLKTKNFKWTSSINLTLPQNKLVSFPGLSNSTLASSLVVGKPFTIVKTYHFLGVDPVTGIYQFADTNGNAVFKPNFSTDLTVVLNTSPKFYGGFQNTFTYKNLELSILFQFVKQIGVDYSLGNYPGGFQNQPISVLNRWVKPSDKAAIQQYTSGYNSSALLGSLYAGSSDAVWSDASYVRLKNLALSWSLPRIWNDKMHLRNARLFLQGQNLITITNYSGMDPENRSVNSLPPLQMFTIGIQVTL